MRSALLTLCFLLITHVVRADDLDVIVDYQTTPEARGEAYHRLMKVDFTTYARKLLTLSTSTPSLTGSGPSTKEPWNEKGLPLMSRIECTLRQLWNERMSERDTHTKTEAIMLEMVEDKSLGLERVSALLHIRVCLYHARGPVPGLPPLDELHSRLEQIARDEQQPLDFRRHVVSVILVKAQPDGYLDLAVQLAANEPTAMQRAVAFFDMTTYAERERFSEETRKKHVRLCFEYLESVDDHRSGVGYHFATKIGHFIGIREVEDSHGPFGPKRSLPKYQGANKDPMTNGYFQDTVDNAMKWWEENKSKY